MRGLGSAFSMLYISDRLSNHSTKLWVTEHCQVDSKDAHTPYGCQKGLKPLWTPEQHLSRRKGCSRAKSIQTYLAVCRP